MRDVFRWYDTEQRIVEDIVQMPIGCMHRGLGIHGLSITIFAGRSIRYGVCSVQLTAEGGGKGVQ